MNTPNSLDREYYDQLFQHEEAGGESSTGKRPKNVSKSVYHPFRLIGTISDVSESEEKSSENSINIRNRESRFRASQLPRQSSSRTVSSFGKSGRRRKSENFASMSECSASDLVLQEQAKADVETERKEKAVEELEIAFDVLKASRDWGASVDQLVYRALIDSCGRCGATDHAVQILGMMHNEGLEPDSLVYSNLVQAFSMNGDQNFKMDILRWENLKREVSAAASRIKTKNSRISRKASSGSNAVPSATLKKFIRLVDSENSFCHESYSVHFRRWGTREEFYSRSDSSTLRYSHSFDASEVQKEFPGILLDTEIEVRLVSCHYCLARYHSVR